MPSLCAGLPVTSLIHPFPIDGHKHAKKEELSLVTFTAAGDDDVKKTKMISKWSKSEQEICRIYFDKYANTCGADFVDILMEATHAINHEIYPELIREGSSGSYFVKNSKGENIGVFKPKDEEPYGDRNPKLMKYMQRLFFPCCFGRSCLVPNQGYLCEAAAWLVDHKLNLNVVPKTAVVFLASPTFNYGCRSSRALAHHRGHSALDKHFQTIGVPPKRGSFQLFVHGYNSATYWLEKWGPNPPLSIRKEFQLQFEHLVILDYIIRNTDRGNDNWLVRYDAPLTSGSEEEGKREMGYPGFVGQPSVSIAAIDNGLAFPFKHPDEVRTYPFRWAGLPIAEQPFSEETIQYILPKLNNTAFIRELSDDLRNIFKTDPSFNISIIEKQMNVMRGQMYNLREALHTRKSPAELVQMTPQYMLELSTRRRRRIHQQQMAPALSDDELEDLTSWHNTFRQVLHTAPPFFSSW